MGFLDAAPAEFAQIHRQTMKLVNEKQAETLRTAAAILRIRSSKPNGLAMRVLCKILNDQADKIASGG